MVIIEFVKDENRAVAYDGDKLVGECVFAEEENIWNIVHTEVDEEYQGQGVAKRLVGCVNENAKNFNKSLVSDCSYAKKVLEKYD